jgi:hypothetical protein
MATEILHEDEPRDGPSIAVIALAVVAALAVLFGAGVVAGVGAAFADDAVRSPVKGMVGIAVGLAVMAGGGYVLWRALPRFRSGIVSPRTRRARSILYLSMAVGGVLGAVLQFSTLGADPRDSITGPISPAVSAFAIAIWVIVVPLLSWRWWRNVDEHEALAYKDGALVAMYAYSAIAPTWWMAWRGGFLPEPQEMVIFMAVILVWGAVWMMRRFA